METEDADVLGLERICGAAGLSCSYKSLLPLWVDAVDKMMPCYRNFCGCLELWNRNASTVGGCIMLVCFNFRHAVAAFM